jgi:ectoine hydroxylase-related dioxygenase (phytanoyl-CoA dioxygenase family)
VHGTGASSNGEFVNTTKRTWTTADERICALRRGGVIIFSDRLLHASTENIAGQDRYSLISTYQASGADEPFDMNFPARHDLPAMLAEQPIH